MSNTGQNKTARNPKLEAQAILAVFDNFKDSMHYNCVEETELIEDLTNYPTDSVEQAFENAYTAEATHEDDCLGGFGYTCEAMGDSGDAIFDEAVKNSDAILVEIKAALDAACETLNN